MSLSPFAATDNLYNYYVFFVFIKPINVVNRKTIMVDIDYAPTINDYINSILKKVDCFIQV